MHCPYRSLLIVINNKNGCYSEGLPKNDCKSFFNDDI